MQVVFSPSTAMGEVTAPPSKSMGHRLLICAGLGEGESIVRGIAPSEDMLATLDCLRALGADFRYEGDTVRMKGVDFQSPFSAAQLPCRECGSTLRFFVPICLLTGAEMTLTGSETLLRRPLSVYEDICREQGLRFEKNDSFLRLCGRLTAGEYTVPGDISSQFISGLLFSLPLLEGNSVIRLIPPVESRPYIDMTMQALAQFGVAAGWLDGQTLSVSGGQRYLAQEVQVEGDYSNAAFFEALNTLGGAVKVTGLREDSLQGDKVYGGYFKLLEQGRAVIDLTDCPDLGPVLFAVAAAHHGGVFTGTRRLKIKESDRGAVMAQELRKFGVETTVGEDTIVVEPAGLHPPDTVLYGHNDHRIVMALSVLLTRTGGVLDGVQAVKKSLPDFFERLQMLNIEVKQNGL